MAPPAPKRRKLGHESDDEDLSSGGDEAIQAPSAKLSKAHHGHASSKSAPQKSQGGSDTVGAYTGGIYKSNMFKLQVDDLLSQVGLKYGTKEAPAGKALRALKSIIERIPARGAKSVVEAESSLLKTSKIAVPFPDPRPPKNANYKLEYAKPSDINVVGSYALKVVTKADECFSIDLMVTMPSTIFQEKDYLNHRYFYKRAYYLACLAAGIKDASDGKFKLTFDTLNGNYLQPILVVKPSGDGSELDFSSSKCQIHIIPSVPEDLFPAEKLHPHRNCIRPANSDEVGTTKALRPTPFYNASVRSDSLIVSYLKLMHGAANQCEAYRDTCLLGRIWLRQRGLRSSVPGGGFGNFEWAALIAILITAKGSDGLPAVSTGYSSYQLFKAALQFLATKDLLKKPLFFGAEMSQTKFGDETPVFFDGPRALNLLYKMMPWSYQLLRTEARSTLASLANSSFDQFESTFIFRVNQPSLRYDYLVEIPTPAIIATQQDGSTHERLYRGMEKIHSVLLRGLADRASLISLELPEENEWTINTPASYFSKSVNLRVAIVVDPANASRLIDHGPSAEEKKAAASFRNFWGDKAELRRFKDGSILESLVWSPKDGSSVMQQIVFHILSRQLNSQIAEQITFTGDQAGKLLSSPTIALGTAAFQGIMDAFKTLEQDIRSLEEMPLAIRHVFAADPQLRYASVEPPMSTRQPLMAEPASVVLQFEGSGRWPDDLEAIQRTKIAFLLKLEELLSEVDSGPTTRVGLENENQEMVNRSFLDVIYPSGAAFRIRIHHDREATLLERRLSDKSITGPQREDTAYALALYKRDFLRLPSHSNALQTLCTRFPMLSPSIRLVKKWFSSHLLASHIAPEVIELLVVRTFVQPHPWPAPSSPITGFLRTLYFIAQWDWRAQPLIVDFSDEMSSEELAKITTRFEAWRKIDPALNRVVIFAASNIDTDGTTWTDSARPARVVAARMTALARAACQAVKNDPIITETTGLFISPLEDYNFVLRLNPDFIRSRQQKRDKSKTQFKNLQIQGVTANEVDAVGGDFISMFLADLQGLYGHAAIFFYGGGESNVIAGLWHPGTARRAWKVKLGYSTKPVPPQPGNNADEMDVELNREAMLGEMTRLGGELVEKAMLVKS